MQIKSAQFTISNTDVQKCPSGNRPEFAFIGRSNVGKSSLINALCNQKRLAKTSSRPGKTQLINHFLINEQWFLVDLPGYGYAKVPKKDLLRNFSHLSVYNNAISIGIINILTWTILYYLFGLGGILVTALGLAITNNNIGITNGWTHRLGDGIVDKPNLLIWALILGSPEAYFHKEHHEKPFKYKHSESWFEWHARLVEIFNNIGLVTINEKK